MNIFIAFANQDRDVRDKLLDQMNLVKVRQGWNIWSAKEIKAGERWGEEIKIRLMDSEVVILLLSTDFFNSKYIVETELPDVEKRHQNGDCHIIPIIARVCHWKETAFGEYAQLGEIQALPAGEKPIISKGYWDNEDQPYFEVVEGIKNSIRTFQLKKREKSEAIERERVALEKRKQGAAQLQRELKARLKQEAEAVRLREEQARLREEQEQAILDAERKRQKEARRADLTAWLLAADVHSIEAYQTYLSHYPQGEYAREARFRIKEQKRPNGMPVSWIRNVTISGAVLILLLLLWAKLNKYDPPVQKNPPLINADSTQILPTTDNQDQPTDTVKKSGLVMIAVEGGTFMMGSPISEPWRDNDECQHKVHIKPFSIGKYEVTQADWREIMGTDPPDLKFKGCDQCPVEMVSWNDVKAFLNRLNEKTKDGKKYRLPNEAEWEYAARGGNRSRGYIYAGSNEIDSVAWYMKNKTHIVGQKNPNELDLYDLSGNVWEWCEDTYKPYPCDRKSKFEYRRIIRGGGWYGRHRCRNAGRYVCSGVSRGGDIGFRLAHD